MISMSKLSRRTSACQESGALMPFRGDPLAIAEFAIIA